MLAGPGERSAARRGAESSSARAARHSQGLLGLHFSHLLLIQVGGAQTWGMR